MKHPVYIRATAAHCALGDCIATIVDGMRAQQVCIEQIPLTQINQAIERPYYRLRFDAQPLQDETETRFYDILYSTVQRAIADAGLEGEQVRRLPVFFGSTSLDIPIYEASYSQGRHLLSNTSMGYGNLVDHLTRHIDSRGPCYTFTTACTSSANALIYAADMIAQGDITQALVIGYDLFCMVGFYGFEAMKLITPPPYKPFDKERQGVIMGEGCAAVVLDRQRRQASDFRYLGGSNGCDTHSVTTHDPQGQVMADVMADALAQAEVRHAQVDVVKAHATGSYHNDLSESNALRRVFAQGVPPVTGLKPFVGHTVGACGALELVLLTEAVKRGFVPPMLNFETLDEALAITPITAPLNISAGTFLLNYFGFGGNCVSLVVSNVYP